MTSTSQYIAGSIAAGCFSTLIGHPLDTIKVHQQTKAQFSSASTLQTAKVLAQGDILRLYKGIGPPMMNQIIMNSIMFSVFHHVKQVANNSAYLDQTSSALLAGMFSGFATACLSTPTDWIKIQVQTTLTQGSKHAQTDSYSILKLALKNDQFKINNFIRTLYRGHMANLAREGVFTMVYLGLYDRISTEVAIKMNYPKDQPHHMSSVMFISSFTGAFAWLCNYPFDTIKSVIQASPTKEKISYWSVVQSLFRSGGITSFFRGAGSSTFRAILVTSSRMIAYEKTTQLMK